MPSSNKSTQLAGVRRVICQVETLEPDPEQYKPTKPILRPVDLWIEVEVPADLVVREEKVGKETRVIYKPDVVAHISNTIRTALRRNYTMPIRGAR